MKPGAAAVRWVLRCAAATALAGPVSCGGTEPRETQRALPSGVVARVGDAAIARGSVARIARAEGISAEEALRRAVADALLAQEAARRLAGTGRVAQLRRSAHARALADELHERAKQEGPAGRQEIERLARERWAEFDRPASARTVHAVVVVKDEADREAARALGERIAEAVADAGDAAEFMRRAREVPANALSVVVERLPPCTADGRVVPEPGRRDGKFDAEFARAANELVSPGAQSPLVTTRFGFHVIMLIERIPEKRSSFEER
ncbi:MAG TPA: peptidyl-prolyl cis-trans isomerase, partial [Polyangiaceae bacterium]